MTEKSITNIIDAALSASQSGKVTPRNLDALNSLISRSSSKELQQIRSYIGKQLSAGLYDPAKSADVLRKLRDQPQSMPDIQNLNTSGISQSNDRFLSERSLKISAVELKEASNPLQAAAGLSLKKTLKFAVYRILLQAFRNIEDRGVEKKANEEWRKTAAEQTNNKHEMLGSRLKGRILLAMFKKQPRINKRSAFFRWKVKADPLLVKDVVDQFALYTRISFTSALWRMKSVLHAIKKLEAQQRRLEKQRRAFRIFDAVFSKKLQRHYKYAFHSIKDTAARRKLFIKILQGFSLYQKMDLKKIFSAWRYASIDKSLEIRRKKLIKVFSKGRDLLRFAFDKWRSRGVFKQLGLETKQGFGGQLMGACLESLLHKRLRDAFSALKKNYDEFKRGEKLKQIMQESGSYAFTLLNIIFHNSQRTSKRIAFDKIRDASNTDKFSKTRVMQRLIFHNEYRIRDALHRWKTICDLERIVSMNTSIRALFSTLNDSLLNSVHPLLQIQAENKKKATLKNMLFATRNRLQEAFSRWRANTSVNHATKEYQKYKNSTFLESVVNKLIKKRYHDGFHAIHKFLRGKETDKFKIAAKLMMYNVESLRNYFNTWAANTHKIATQLKSSSIQNLFYILKDVHFSNAKAIFDAAEQQRKKHSTLKLLMTQLQNLKKNAFYIWAARVSHRKIQQELNWRKRLQIADVLVLRLDFMYRNQLRAAFSNIFTEGKHKKLMIRAIISMQRTVFDQVKAAFMTWQNYKNSLRHENARKVAFMLRNYTEKNVRLGFQSIKDEWRRKQFIMQKTIKKLEVSSASNAKFYFYKWMKAVETMKALEKFQGTLGFFGVIKEVFNPTLSVLFDTQIIREQKQKVFK